MAYLAEPSVMGLGLQAAGKLVAMYWLGALVGRLLGGFILRLAKPGRVLTTFAAGAISLIILSAVTTGALSGWALILVGFCNSLMFPTIFSLATEGLGDRKIVRVSCRESVWQYVLISVVAVSLKKKNKTV